jgi:hypothetical protein
VRVVVVTVVLAMIVGAVGGDRIVVPGSIGGMVIDRHAGILADPFAGR